MARIVHKSMKVIVDLIDDSDTQPTINSTEIQRWVAITLRSINLNTNVSVCIKLVSQKDAADLNMQYRNKNSPTNVLSFKSLLPNSFESLLSTHHLGYIVICPEIVQNEASEQKKSEVAHYAHLVVHGTLHLNGFKHETIDEAQNMEKEEIKVLEKLGFPNPYLIG